MPNYIQNIRRVPRPGKFNSILERQVETLKSLNRAGNVSFSVSNSSDMDGLLQPSLLSTLFPMLRIFTILSEVILML